MNAIAQMFFLLWLMEKSTSDKAVIVVEAQNKLIQEMSDFQNLLTKEIEKLHDRSREARPCAGSTL